MRKQAMNDFQMIQNIFDEYNNRNGVELPETRKAQDEVAEYIDSIGLPKEQNAKLQELAMAVACETERQGFYHGFTAGLQLASEMRSIYRT